MLINPRLAFQPLNYLIVFFMVFIPCLAVELTIDRVKNDCGCFSNN